MRSSDLIYKFTFVNWNHWTSHSVIELNEKLYSTKSNSCPGYRNQSYDVVNSVLCCTETALYETFSFIYID